MSDGITRKAFEAHCLRNGVHPNLLTRDSSDRYLIAVIDQDWRTWSAAWLAYSTMILASGNPGNRVKHLKRGSTYRLTGVAELQSSLPIAEGEKLCIYVSETESKAYARPTSEFTDGRFVEIPDFEP